MSSTEITSLHWNLLLDTLDLCHLLAVQGKVYVRDIPRIHPLAETPVSDHELVRRRWIYLNRMRVFVNKLGSYDLFQDYDPWDEVWVIRVDHPRELARCVIGHLDRLVQAERGKR